MRLIVSIGILSMLWLAGCRSGPANANSTGASLPRPSAAPVRSKIDVCSLLSRDDLKAVQGEAYKDAQRSDRPEGEYVVGQCYYAMPTSANAVVINVTTAKDEPGARSPKVLWGQAFGSDEDKEREGHNERERENEKAKEPLDRAEEGEAKEAAPERIRDLGQAAYWVANPIGGALYVLKNDLFVRISVGGSGDQKAKLNKSKTLAQTILKKL
ncbi:MAG TPA: hypothetical protein VE961_02735 [Pyrinomonadaceae bacterium]|nr:hypothetical protein [Pyrinomonadaceae bacterium]